MSALEGGGAEAPHLRFRWLALAAAALTLVTTSRVYLSLSIKGFTDPVPELLAAEALRWALWIPVAPLIIALDRRWGFGTGADWFAAGVHVLGAVSVLLAHTLAMTLAGHAAGWYFILETPGETTLIQLVHEGPSVALVYAALVGGDHLWRHLHGRERRRTARANLEARLARERLRYLQMQLQPHFLFNALHAVGGLLREGDRDTAVETVSELGVLLRRSLRHGDRQEVTLDEELDFLRSYLKIQKARYGSRLEVDIDVDPAARSALVPHLVLQPIVENAIEHGTSRREGTGTVKIGARLREGRLLLEVRDDGPGPGSGEVAEGIGLRNTRERLVGLYDDDFTFRLERDGGGGTRVRIEIPRCAAAGDGPAGHHAGGAAPRTRGNGAEGGPDG